jgi:hypothetical protein
MVTSIVSLSALHISIEGSRKDFGAEYAASLSDLGGLWQFMHLPSNDHYNYPGPFC